MAGTLSCGTKAEAFDGKRAYEMLKRQCAFGPRTPGTAAHDSCFTFLVSEFRKYAGVVETDTFPCYSAPLKKDLTLFNAVARFQPQYTTRVLIGAHWDTRPWADRDPIPAKRHLPVMGANDGASGVAVLLELARLLKSANLTVGVDLAIFDGEDLGTDDDPNGWFRGSNRYVEWKLDEKPPVFVIVIDMVGEKDPAFHWEGHSRRMAPNIVDLVWEEARSLGVRSFRSDVKHTVFDDHVPFLNAEIPAVVVIDFDYPEWHTTRDLPDRCSAESLEGVGKVLLSLVTRPDIVAH
jgi:hypothetical protein